MQHALLLISLWIMVIVAAEPYIRMFLQWRSSVREFSRYRRRLEIMLTAFRTLYEQASTDYLRGYYYCKIRMTEIELEEMRK